MTVSLSLPRLRPSPIDLIVSTDTAKRVGSTLPPRSRVPGTHLNEHRTPESPSWPNLDPGG